MAISRNAILQIIWVLVISSVLLGSMTATAQSHRRHHHMADPLFGISYDPQKVIFERAPTSISKLCSDLHGRKLWVYAHLKATDTEYLIVSGFAKVHSDDHGRGGIEPDFGTAVALRGTKCIDDQSEFFLRGEINPSKDATPIQAPEAVLNAIAADALNRYAKAFGGKRIFLELLSEDDRKAMPPVLQRQLELFEK